jgi:Na+-translocating ferredoxin:NAD+ oxidoreductase RnfG subunit
LIRRRRDHRIGIVIFLAAAAMILCPLGVASAKVFASQAQALAEAFPDASRIERRTVVLLKKDAAKIAELVGKELIAKVVVLHTGYRDGEVLGYAHIDVHNVRTQPEAFLIVLTPKGTVRSVRILAFHEPLDYLPTTRWYEQFAGKTADDSFRVGRDVHGVVGATLSARAAADSVRRMLAYWQVLLRPAEVHTQAP